MRTHLSLFSGIGGLDLADEWAGFTTVGQCEWADYPTKVLEKHWPDVPRWRDIRTLTGGSFYERTGLHTVDIISGGFPCQPFSSAGKRRGKEDDRYLWPEMVRVIKELRPTWVVGENVAGIVKMVLPEILSELEACGYRTRTFLVPAYAVGARHRRYRVAIVGWNADCGEWNQGTEQRMEKWENSHSSGICTNMAHTDCGRQLYGQNEIYATKRREQAQLESGGCCKVLADTEGQHERRLSVREKKEKSGLIGSSKNIQHSHSTGCKKQYTTEKSDEEGFLGGGYTEGAICNPTSQGLSDGTGRQMERPEPEQEPERPSSNASDTNNGSKSLWGNGQLSAAEEVGEKRCDNRGREKEHEPRERRTTQPGLGRMADGISGGMDEDLDFIIDHYWDIEPDIPRVAVGVKDRVGRLKALGNAVVPQQFWPFFKAISECWNEKEL